MSFRCKVFIAILILLGSITGGTAGFVFLEGGSMTDAARTTVSILSTFGVDEFGTPMTARTGLAAFLVCCEACVALILIHAAGKALFSRPTNASVPINPDLLLQRESTDPIPLSSRGTEPSTRLVAQELNTFKEMSGATASEDVAPVITSSGSAREKSNRPSEPAAPVVTQRSTVDTATMRQKNSKPKIIIVDDDPTVLRTYSALFEKEGMIAITAVDGSEAYELIMSERPDAAVIDFMLPLVSGIEVCQKVRAYNSLLHTKLVLFTVDGQCQTRDHAIQAGADAVVTKGHDPSLLIKTVRELIEQD